MKVFKVSEEKINAYKRNKALAAQAKVTDKGVHVQVKGAPVNRYFGAAFDIEVEETALAKLRELFDEVPKELRLDSLNMAGSTRSYVPAYIGWIDNTEDFCITLSVGKELDHVVVMYPEDADGIHQLVTDLTRKSTEFYPPNNLDIAASVLSVMLEKQKINLN